MTRTLLIADDARVIRELIKAATTAAGWQVVGEATNGEEAVARYRDLKPDACTLDLVMPEYNGFFALRGILDTDPDAKVLVVSALEQKAIFEDAFKLGAADFLVKPFDKKGLVESLEHLVPADNSASAGA